MGDLTLRRTDKGRLAIEIVDLIYFISCWSSEKADRLSLIEQIIASSDFAEAFKTVISGCSDEEYCRTTAGASELRQLILENADHAAQELVKNLLGRISELMNNLEDTIKHNKEILDAWPESYRKYIPQKLLTYSRAFDVDKWTDKLLGELPNDKQ